MRALLTTFALLTLSAAPALASPPATSGSSSNGTDQTANRITGSPNYVPTFGLRASISRGFDVRGVLSVDAGLDVPDAKDRQRVEALKPRIMNSMRDAVLNYASRSYIVGERPNVDLLRTRLQKSVDDIVGKNKAQVALASVIVFQD